MNEQVAGLINTYWEIFKEASFISAETFMEKHPGYLCVRLPEGCGKDDERAVVFVLTALENSAKKGIPTIVVEPVFGGFSKSLLEKLQEIGLLVSNIGTSRHRHCPHNNIDNDKCLYDDVFDHGAGVITDDLLVISLPLTEAGAT